MNTWIGLALVALLFFGVTGLTQKVSTNNISFSLSFVYFAAGIVLVSLAVWIVEPLGKTHLTAGNVSLAALGGFLNALGAFTSFIALEKGGKASIVIPIVNLYPLVTALGAFLFLGESLAARQLWGLLLALIAVVLLSRESDTPVVSNVRV
jgi:bacterial/archaeal transporter family protein